MSVESESIIQNRKHYQRNKILSIIRFQKTVSRNDIKNLTAYSMTTVLNTVDELISLGYVTEKECEENRIGRRPVWLQLNPDGGYFVGIEFNAKKMHCDVIDFTGKVIYSKTREMSRKDTQDQIIDKILDSIGQAKESLGEKSTKLLGIGIGAPGYVDKEKGIAKEYVHFEKWENVNLKVIIEKAEHIPCYIDNNVNVMAFAYKWFYFNGDCDDFIFMSIRTGARMIPVIGNQLIFSNTGFSGEIGHIRIVPSHSMCTCGQFGCLNTEISDFAVEAKIKEGIMIGRFPEIREMCHDDPEQVTMDIFIESVKQGHGDSVELMKSLAFYLGTALGMVVNIFAPKEIILYGELAKIGESFICEVQKVAEQGVIPENKKGFKVVSSRQGEDLGAIGAAALVMQEQFDFIDIMI